MSHAQRKPRVVLVSLLIMFSMIAAPFSSLAITTASSPVSRRSTAPVPTVPLTQAFTLRRGFFQDIELDSFSNRSLLMYAVSSDVPISTALMTSVQHDQFVNNPNDPISNSLTYQNGSSGRNSVVIPLGKFFLVLYAYLTRANVQLGYDLYPTTPFSYGPVSPPPLASGISSFGIYNYSGIAVPYEIRTSQILGVANISSIQVNTPNALSYGDNVAGATLQLNANLVVNEGGNSSQKVYWVQNTPDFVTSASKVSFGDEIWNSTDLNGYLDNQTVTSPNFKNGGFVSPTTGSNASQSVDVYDYSPNNKTYALPLHFGLLVNEVVLPKTGVMVQFGYRVLANGSAFRPTTTWFDNVTIHDVKVQNTYFDVTGNSTTPVGNYYNAELVFAGEANYETAHFTQLNSTLGLFYLNGTNKTLVSFPTYYDFGGNTGEAVDNLVVTFANGVAQITPGTSPNYVYLGSASLVLDPNSLHVSGTSTSLATTTSLGGTTSSVTSNSSSGRVSTSAAASGSASGSSSSSLTTGILIGVGGTVLVFAIIGVAFMALRRPKPTEPPPMAPF